jgi:hypothetical protein
VVENENSAVAANQILVSAVKYLDQQRELVAGILALGPTQGSLRSYLILPLAIACFLLDRVSKAETNGGDRWLSFRNTADIA